MPTRILTLALLLLAAPALHAAPPQHANNFATMYIEKGDEGFDVFLAAAMVKKNVPVTILDHEEGATYILKAAKVETTKVGTGSKVVNCLFAYCGGNSDKGNVSVQLVENGTIKWSYAVNKARGEKNRQALAEAIAKHLKSEFFKQ